MTTLYTHHQGFSSSPALPTQLLSTPPYTPIRPKQSRPSHRADSPASLASSIHPAEQESPAKKATKESAPVAGYDDVRVEELTEGDIGYQTDIDVVYPYELEERDSDGDSNDYDSQDSESDDENMGMGGDITNRIAKMRCNDETAGEAAGQSRHRTLNQRTGSRIFKRSHSQSVKAENSADVESADMDALGDHDLEISKRRLRRRVRGPPPPSNTPTTDFPLSPSLQGSPSPTAGRLRHLMGDIPRSSPEAWATAGESGPGGSSSPAGGYASANMMDDDSDENDPHDLMARMKHWRAEAMDVDDDDDDE